MKKLIISVLLLNLLAACGSNPPKAEVADAKPAQSEATAVAAPAANQPATTSAVAPAAAAQANAAPSPASTVTKAAPAAEPENTAVMPATATSAAQEAKYTKEARTASVAGDSAQGGGSVYFPFDVDAVQAEDMDTILAQAKNLSAHASLSARVEGNADERGSSEYNLALGQRRANNTKKALVLGGARSDQIETVSYGEEKPRATGHDEASWAQNRRADIKVGE
ncbi:MAG: OmpA family protein [Sideroxydans sp.]|nr:OmpA family protein [Sideroxydans sp.]